MDVGCCPCMDGSVQSALAFVPPAAFWGMQPHGPPQLVSFPSTGKLFSWSTLMAPSHSPS